MGRIGNWMAIAAVSLAAIAVAPSAALAKTDVTVIEVKLPDGHSSKDLERSVRGAVAHAAKSARFGKTKHVDVTIRLSELSIEETDGIVHVTCTMTGQLKGGGAARSHVSFGDKPAKKKQLVKQALRMAAESVVTRLADVVRERQEEATKDRRKDEKKGKTKPGVIGTRAR